MRRFLRFIFKCEQATVHGVYSILHLPLWKRITHRKSRKPIMGLCVSISIMLIGSSVALGADMICHILPLPHVIVDAFAYFTHGIGAIPCVKYAEPLWAIFFAEMEEIE